MSTRHTSDPSVSATYLCASPHRRGGGESHPFTNVPSCCDGGAGLPRRTIAKTKNQHRKTRMKTITTTKLGTTLAGVLAISFGPLVNTSCGLIVENPGFETPVITAPSGFVYTPPTGPGQPWAFSFPSGLSNGGGFDVSGTHDGQYAILQRVSPANSGTISQTINFDAPGLFQLSYLEAGRNGQGDLNYSVTIQAGANPAVLFVNDFTTSNQVFTPTSYGFTIPTPGDYLLSFHAVSARTGNPDATAYFDNVSIVPEPTSALLLLGSGAMLLLRRRRAAA